MIIYRLPLISIGFMVLMSCSKDSNSDSSPVLLQELTVGSGFFEYSDYLPFDGKVMKIYYNIPSTSTSNTPIVFIFHGNGRNAKDYKDAIISKSNQYEFIAIVPEFSIANFSNGDSYNLGNVFLDGDNPSLSTLNPEPKWTFSVIEPLFDYIKTSLNNFSPTYDIIGHSAGGQFAHRFLMFKPDARSQKIIASASGWYTEVNPTVTFPYGFKDSPLEMTSLENLFEKNLIIQVGNQDNDPNASGLRHNNFADAQGLNRYTRALYFFNSASQLATNQTIDFNWELNINVGADHNFIIAIENAADLLFN